MTDYRALRVEWEALLARRAAFREALEFWTPILDGWAAWDRGAVPTLRLSLAECGERWTAGLPLLADAAPDVPSASIEDLLGPLIERLAAAGPDEGAALARFAAAWDAGDIGPADLMPGSGKDGPAALQERLGVPGRLSAFLAHAGLRPALDAHFELVRTLPDGAWTSGTCPWCGGIAAWVAITGDGRRQLSCHLCGGDWVVPAAICPSCAGGRPEDVVRLAGTELVDGEFIEACRACSGYLKGIDRRQRVGASSPLVEDWGTPHLDVLAAHQGYWRATPSLAQFLP